MKEKLKSLLLLLLVICSLFLTYQLWYGQKPVDMITDNGYERAFFEEPRPLQQVIAPYRILLHDNDALYLFGEGESAFRNIWRKISSLMQDLTDFEGRAVEQLPDESELFLEIMFSPQFPVGSGTVWFKNVSYRELAGLQIWSMKDAYWIILRELNESRQSILLLSKEEGLMLDKIHWELFLSGKTGYRVLVPGEIIPVRGADVTTVVSLYVPDGDLVMDELILSRENLDQDLLTKAFFINPNMVRVIEEREGSLIFTDGERGLQIGEGLDYLHPQLEKDGTSLSYVAALNSSSRLLAHYGGWPINLRLESIDLQINSAYNQEAYHASWCYNYNGYPLIGKVGVSMVFNDSGLVEYRRNLYVPIRSDSSFQVKGYLEALQAAVTLLYDEDETAEPVVLEKMELAYRVAGSSYQPRGVPIWVLSLDGTTLYLRANDLVLLEKKSL